jgi:hypothetical protein
LKVVLARDFGGDGFVVWAMLDDPDYNGQPQDRGESFVIGQGATPAEAVDEAIRDLKRAWEQTEALRELPT